MTKMNDDELKDILSELPELKKEIVEYKRALRTICRMCDAPYFNSERRWKIRDLCNSILKTPHGE